MSDTTESIGVIGAGISGITAAWLLSRRHPVTLIEKESQLGGHTRTVFIERGPDRGTPIDMGFIVLNDRNYTTLLNLFSQWGVRVQNSDMSFGFQDRRSGFYYSSDIPGGLFARRRNLISPSFWRLVRDIFRFNHIAAKELRKGLGDLTLGQFLEKYSFSKSYIDFHIVPVSAAVWSTPSEHILDFPAESILRFYDNHGLLSLTNRPQWKTVVGGSISYIRAFEKQFQGVIRRASPVRSVTRVRNKIRVVMNDGTQLDFDFVVLATHADTSLRLLIDPETDEKTILSKWSYTRNPVALHTDGQVMPPRRSAWASWNYTRNHREGIRPALNLSYYMNRLQRLNTIEDYFVTLNGDGWFNPDRCIESIIFDHPCYTFDSLSTHKALETINGKDRIYYCGAYCGFGFHEDGARSGLAVAKKFGIGL